MQETVVPVDWRRVLKVLVVLGLVIAAIWFASRIPRTVTIFVFAGFIASAVQPAAVFLERRRVNRPLAIAIVYLVLIVLAGVCAFFVLPEIIAQTQVLVGNSPHYMQTFQVWLTHALAGLEARFPGLFVPANLLNVKQIGSDRIAGFLSTALGSIGAIAINLATGLFIAFSALILSVFFLLNHRQLATGFAALFPERRRAMARRLAAEVVQVFGSYIVGQVIVSAITGIAIAILCAIFGFKYALLLGLISAIAYAIPVVGMIAAHLLGLVMAAPQGLYMIIVVEAILFVVSRISDSVISPKIMGSSVGISPIGIIFAVFAGGELFGIAGLIMGIPAAALVRLLWRYFVLPYLHGTEGA